MKAIYDWMAKNEVDGNIRTADLFIFLNSLENRLIDELWEAVSEQFCHDVPEDEPSVIADEKIFRETVKKILNKD